MKYGEEFNPYMKFHGLWIPNTIAMSRIPDSAKLLLGRLMQFSGADGKAYPTRKRLCKELGWDKNKVDRAIKFLKEIKLIKAVPLDLENHQSPNLYTFLHHPMYDDPLIKSDNTPLSNLIGHNRVSEIDDKDNRITFSYEKGPQAGQEVFNGLVCKKCGERQFSTRSGDTCKNGHGGVEGVKIEEYKRPSLFTGVRIGGPKLKKTEPKGLTSYPYSKEAKEILKCWIDGGGKVHVNGSAKGCPKVQTIIDELLIEGRNPYISLIDDPILRMRQWTVQEIIDCIEFYTGPEGLNKDVDKWYFDAFVIRRFQGFKGRDRQDSSPLVESLKQLPNHSSTKWGSILLERFNKTFPKATVYNKSIFTIASFLESKVDDYKISDVGGNHFLPNMFISYMEREVSKAGNYDPIQYMANPLNIDKFWKGLLKSFKAKKRTPKEKAQWLKEKPIKEANRKKSLEKRNTQRKKELLN